MKRNKITLRSCIAPVAVAVSMGLTGCTAMQPQTAGEWAFHSANLVDVLQTVSHGADDCYTESDRVTARLLGDNPEPAETLAWGLAVSGLHRFISWEMQRNDVPLWVQNTFNAITFTTKASAIVNNHNHGIRIDGNNDHSASGSNLPGCQ